MADQLHLLIFVPSWRSITMQFGTPKSSFKIRPCHSMPSLFARREKLLIAVIHLLPLPGSPRWAGDFEAVIDRALADAAAYEQGGARAVIIENFGDVPFTKSAVPPETVAAMAAAGREVSKATKLT